jgi:DUF438 domain-containing protein
MTNGKDFEFNTGIISKDELGLILDTLPVDITFKTIDDSELTTIN